jgi:hypothetical protein
MSQKFDNLSTGIKGLDGDLRKLYATCQDKKKLEAIKQAIANKDISSEEFSKVVPEVLVRLSFFLAGPQFSILSKEINEEALDSVKEAK